MTQFLQPFGTDILNVTSGSLCQLFHVTPHVTVYVLGEEQFLDRPDISSESFQNGVSSGQPVLLVTGL